MSLDPYKKFDLWFQEAIKAGVLMPEAMCVATANSLGIPDARMLLLKEVSPEGFVFFTNYESPKADQLAENPRATCVFYWQLLERQIRVSGTVSRVSAQESDQYFCTRPRGSQVGAWASHQSRPIANRAVLEAACVLVEEQYMGQEIPRPPHWGGYRLKAQRIEFWQGRESRLHDRELYVQDGDEWILTRLAP